jgi:hypothetical protein
LLEAPGTHRGGRLMLRCNGAAGYPQ